MTEPESLVLALLRDMRADLGRMDNKMDNLGAGLRSEMDNLGADLRSEMHSLRADVASDLVSLERRLSDQIVGLRRAVMEYHSSAIGHGVLISEFEERRRRVEQHLNLPPADPH